MTDSIIIINPLPLRNRKPRVIRPRLPGIIVPHDGLDKFQICFLRHLLKELWPATFLSIAFSNKSRRNYHLPTTFKINILPFSNLISIKNKISSPHDVNSIMSIIPFVLFTGF